MEFEELVEVALAFLEEELMAERGLVIHADPGERVAIVQGHRGFASADLTEIETIRWEWRAPGLIEWQQGRSRIGCPLPDGGLLYADHQAARFQPVHLEALEDFAQHYAQLLEEMRLFPAPPELVKAFPNLAPAADDGEPIPLPPGTLLVDWL